MLFLCGTCKSLTQGNRITTLDGTVYNLNLNEPLNSLSFDDVSERISMIAVSDYTVWAADLNSNGQAVIGTNRGTALVNVETGSLSWVCHCKSDVLSLQSDHTGNFILCGLRNGTILTIDARQKPEEFSGRLPKHRIPYPSREPSSRRFKKLSNEWFELKGNVYPSRTAIMPSSVSCLASLKLYDQYFLASSMDGSIKMYDHRLIQRGPVQSYEGHVNSHTRIQLGVDPSERFVMSGGEDCYVRLWSIKSGQLLLEDKFMSSIPSVVCWPGTDGMKSTTGNQSYWEKHCRGAWIGSKEGLFYMK